LAERRPEPYIGSVTISPAIVWLAIAVIALAIEAANLSLIFLFIGIAALLAGSVSAVGIPLLGQLIVFALAALIVPTFLRPRLLMKLQSKGVMSRTDALIGQTGRITETIDPIAGSGRVIVGGHDWAASSTERLQPGTFVEILGSDGIVLLVAPVPSPIESTST
jgi:membrane protein implicated in regulation of membrane protease activity